MAETRRKGLSGLDKVLIGCGIGCAGLILVVVLGAAFGSMWFFTPGKQIATDVIADEESLGVVRLHELAEDPGTQELLIRVLERINEAGREQQREDLPPSLRWISDMQNPQADTSSINMMIPKEMTVVFEPTEDGSDVDFVVAANPRVMVRMFKTMFSLISRTDDGDAIRTDYRGHAAYTLEDEAHLAFAASTVLFASSRPALERAIDRVESLQNRVESLQNRVVAGEPGDGSRSTEAVDISPLIPQGAWDVEGVLSNEAGLIAGLLTDLAQSDDPESKLVTDEKRFGDLPDDLRLGFGLDVVSADEVAGRLVLECSDRQAAERWRALLEQRIQELYGEASERGLKIDLEIQTEGHQVISELRLLGVEGLLAEMFSPPNPEE